MASFRLLLVLALGCTATRFDQADCRDTTECRAAFGVGWVCQEDGFCLQEPPPLRCQMTQPEMLFENNESRDRIVIGTLVDASLATHVARANAVRLAVIDANNAGGIDGRPFGLVVCDIQESFMGDELNREQAAVAMGQYLEEVVGVPAIIGAPGSGETQSLFQSTDDVVLISPSSTSPELTTLEPVPASDEAPGRLWRTAPTDEEQARQIQLDMDSRTVGDAFVVAQSGAYGDGLVALLGNDTRTAVSVRFSTAGTLSNALNVVADETDVEEIVFISSDTSDAIAFLTAAVEDPRLDGKTFMLTDAAANEDLLTGLSALSAEQASDLYGRIRGTEPRQSDGLTTEFATRYRIEFGETNVEALSFTSHAYDAGWLALYGAAWAQLQEGSVTPHNLARGLRQVSEGDSVDVGELSWTGVLESFRAGQSIDVNGASGALDYAADTEERSEAGRGFGVWRISSDGTTICDASDTPCVAGE